MINTVILIQFLKQKPVKKLWSNFQWLRLIFKFLSIRKKAICVINLNKIIHSIILNVAILESKTESFLIEFHLEITFYINVAAILYQIFNNFQMSFFERKMNQCFLKSFSAFAKCTKEVALFHQYFALIIDILCQIVHLKRMKIIWSQTAKKSHRIKAIILIKSFFF